MSAAQKTYTVAIAGLGKRGTHHAEAFAANPRFKIVGVCDIEQARADSAKQKFGDVYASTDSADMLAHTRPDITLGRKRVDLGGSMSPRIGSSLPESSRSSLNCESPSQGRTRVAPPCKSRRSAAQ